MDSENNLEYQLKKETIKKKVSLMNNSKFYPYTDKIQITENDISKYLVHFLHESIHREIYNWQINHLSQDFAILFNYLKKFYVDKKSEIFLKDSDYYKVIFDKKGEHTVSTLEMIKYTMSNSDELDRCLVKNTEFVDYCKFCVEIFETYRKLLDVSKVLNEGLATYYSFNADSDCILFDAMNIPNIFTVAAENGISIENIKNYQQTLKDELLSDFSYDSDSPTLYQYSYSLTRFLIKIYGERNLIDIITKIMNSQYDIYGLKLLDYSFNERLDIIDSYLSLDDMYYGLFIKFNEINSFLLKSEKFTLD